MLKKISILFLSVLTAVAILPSRAHALTLTPPRIELTANPGETVTAKMTLINEHATAESYYSSFANFEASGESGTPSFVDPHDDLGTWMHVPESLTIVGGGSQDVMVSIAVPKDATPGGHFAAVFWGTQPKNPVPGQVAVGAKTGSLVLLHINGATKEAGGLIEFDTLDHIRFYTALPVSFYYRFQNNGGDRIAPKGDLVMRDTIGLTADRVPGNPVDGNVLPQSTRRIETAWVGRDGAKGLIPDGFFDAALYELHNFAFGRYGAHLELAYGTKGEKTNSVIHLWVFPWQLILIIVLLFLIIFFGTRGAIRHYNKWVIGRAEAMLEEREASMQKKTIVHRVMKAVSKPRSKKKVS